MLPSERFRKAADPQYTQTCRSRSSVHSLPVIPVHRDGHAGRFRRTHQNIAPAEAAAAFRPVGSRVTEGAITLEPCMSKRPPIGVSMAISERAVVVNPELDPVRIPVEVRFPVVNEQHNDLPRLANHLAAGGDNQSSTHSINNLSCCMMQLLPRSSEPIPCTRHHGPLSWMTRPARRRFPPYRTPPPSKKCARCRRRCR